LDAGWDLEQTTGQQVNIEYVGPVLFLLDGERVRQ
jgi:hypothetical protein